MVQDPIQNIVAHPEFKQLYSLDPVAGGLSSSELKVMADLIVENMPPHGYRTIEMCVKPSSNHSFAHTACAISEFWRGKLPLFSLVYFNYSC